MAKIMTHNKKEADHITHILSHACYNIESRQQKRKKNIEMVIGGHRGSNPRINTDGWIKKESRGGDNDGDGYGMAWVE